MSDLRAYLAPSGAVRRYLLIAGVGAILRSLLQLAIPTSIEAIFDDVIPRGDAGALALAGLGLLLLYAAQAGLGTGSRLAILRITKRATTRWRETLAAKLLALPRTFFHEADRGHLHNTLVQHTERADVLVSRFGADVVPAIATAGLLGGLVVYLDWRLALLFVVLMAVAAVVAIGVLVPRARTRARRFDQSFDLYSRESYRLLERTELTRAHAAERAEMERFRRESGDLHRTSLDMAELSVWTELIQQSVLPGIGIAVLVVGGAFVARAELATGELIAIYVAIVMLRGPLGILVSRYPNLVEGRVAINGIFELRDEPVKEPYSGGRAVADPTEISLERVAFSYGDVRLLSDVSMVARRGSTTAISGANGSGKTTLLYLMLGFYRPQEGTLRADGVPFEQLDVSSLRRSIGFVSQDPLFFDGTIRENVTFGLEGLQEEDLDAASVAACAADFIDDLPDGYDTDIGEGAMRLSGGQRQRLAIMRALLRRPAFLLLDEPGNHLDQGTLQRILDNVRATDPAPGIVLVAHGAEALDLAEDVYRLVDGSLRFITD